MQHPLLYLGLMGFDAESEAAVKCWLDKNAAITDGEAPAEQHPIWQIVDFRQADALLIRGAGVVQGFGTHLQFLPALQGKDALAPPGPLGVDLRGIKLPFVLSDAEHLHALGVDVSNQWVLNRLDEAGMLRALQHFEASLRTLRSLFALGMELLDRKQELEVEHTYHLEHNGNLDAIVDMPLRRVLMRPGTRPIDISMDAWLRRPKSANFAPHEFVECSLDEIGWVYAMHGHQIELPKRYRSKQIYIHRNPQVRGSLMSSRHAALVDHLWQHPLTLAELYRDRPDLSEWLERDLHALYLVRCISTQDPAESSASVSSLPGAFASASTWLSRRSHHASSQYASLHAGTATGIHAKKRMNTQTDDLQPLL